MIQQRKRRWIIGIIIIVAVCICLLWLLMRWLSTNPFLFDYGTLPPQQAFQRVLRQPPPKGATDLTIAGHGFAQGHAVWMRFRLTPETLDDFLAKLVTEELTAEEFNQETPLPVEDDVWRRDALKARWDEIPNIKSPEFYNFSATEAGAGWYGAMAVDRNNSVVYVYATIL
jgi:hypothetical protein